MADEGKPDRSALCGEWNVELVAEGHRYVVHRARDGSPVDTKGLVSVTGFTESLFAEFDGPAVLAKMRPDRRAAKYGAQSNGEILAAWKHKGERAATLGTAMHAYIEDYLKGLMAGEPRHLVPHRPPPQPDEPGSSGVVILPEVFIAFAKTLARRKLFPVAVEKCVYDHELQMAGTVDAIFRDESDGTYWIFDWKRRPEYTRGSPFAGGKPGTPAAGMPCCHHSKATVQLNLYRGILRRAGFFGVGDPAGRKAACDAKALRIVTIHPDLPEGFREDEVPVDDALFEAVVEYRKQMLANAAR
jgi:hypothetical protein